MAITKRRWALVGALVLLAGCSDDSGQNSNQPRCGDGMLDPGEICDGEYFGNESCENRGYYRGTLTCAADCSEATEEDCEGECGDGAVDPEEICDPQAPLTETCDSLGYYPGTLACFASCNGWNTMGCGGTCGDTTINGGELCDGENFDGATCESLGYSLGGTLSCDASCVLSKSGCCGDGTLGGAEACDDTNTADWDGCNTCEIYEMLVNTETNGQQEAKDVAVAADGSFVVVFRGQDASSWNVYARHYNAQGVPLGAEFMVHADAAGNQTDPRIAMNALGSFVVGWRHSDYGTGVHELRTQRFTPGGSPFGGPIVVASGLQFYVDLAMTSSGGFVAAWLDSDGASDVIRARRFSQSGIPTGSPLAASTNTTTTKSQPRVATFSDDGFIVVWTSYGNQDGDGLGVYGQRFDSSDAPVGGETLINPYVTGDQSSPYVAAAPGDGFIIAWKSDGEDGSGDGVFFRRYDSSGNALGQHTQANVHTDDSQSAPTIAVAASGSFVIGWNSGYQDGSFTGAFARLFDAQGSPTGGEIQLNRYTDGIQSLKQIAASPAGSFVAVWTDYELDGDEQGVFMQRFDSQGTAVGVGPFAP